MSIECNRYVDPTDLPIEITSADIVLWDTDPELAYHASSPNSFSKRPGRRYGPGAGKADFVTDSPIPWLDHRFEKAGTIHLSGSWQEISKVEKSVNAGKIPDRPFVLVSQPSLFDSSRAPNGLHTVWAYAHVPNGMKDSPTSIIKKEIERFAPGFSKAILDVKSISANEYSHYNPNYVGGDITGGATRGSQLFTSGNFKGNDQSTALIARESFFSDMHNFPKRLIKEPWNLPKEGWYLCSGATPPGPGVHGMSGYIAAKLALSELRNK